MPVNFNPQEIFLLKRYVSIDYFCALRDTWGEMVVHVESCLAKLMASIPRDYRSRPLPEQPDVVWGHRVLPNFRKTMQGLQTGFILLSHGDFNGLTYAWGPRNDFKGQMDFWSGWMTREDENTYGDLLNKSLTMATNICRTERAGWNPADLANYCDEWGPLDAPARWPSYKTNTGVSVPTGSKLKISGIYVADVENSCSQFLSTSYKVAPAAKVLVGVQPVIDPTTGEQYDQERIFENRDCIWYLVECNHETDPARDAGASLPELGRVVAGEVCPETGFYFTPAKTDARRLFKKGEIMPEAQSEYGQTIWQLEKH